MGDVRNISAVVVGAMENLVSINSNVVLQEASAIQGS